MDYLVIDYPLTRIVASCGWQIAHPGLCCAPPTSVLPLCSGVGAPEPVSSPLFPLVSIGLSLPPPPRLTPQTFRAAARLFLSQPDPWMCTALWAQNYLGTLFKKKIKASSFLCALSAKLPLDMPFTMQCTSSDCASPGHPASLRGDHHFHQDFSPTSPSCSSWPR